MLKGARKSTPEALKLPKRQPLLVEDILAVRDHLNLALPLDAAFFACLTTTFFTAARLGEFTVKNLSSFNAEAHIKITDVQRGVLDRSGNEVTTFHTPQTKTVRGGETVFWARQEGRADPDLALTNHIEVNQPPPMAHLFAYRHDNAYRPLTKAIFLARLKKALNDAKRPIKHGHNIRISATLEYLLRGVPFEAMKGIGRWSSDEIPAQAHADPSPLRPGQP
jgi:hypothetical protein